MGYGLEGVLTDDNASLIIDSNSLLGLDLNNSKREYGPPDEMGHFAMNPRGKGNRDG